jgi:Vam6/Vps39-like protein vacuolar protein sorting-associated protein 39
MPIPWRFFLLAVRTTVHTALLVAHFYDTDATVTLLPLPALSPPTVLAKAKGAMSFGVHTSVQQVQADGAQTPDEDTSKGASTQPSVITRLVVGCKRRVVVYTWVDGEPQEPKVRTPKNLAIEYSDLSAKEVPLQHSPRAVAFFGPNTACLAYPANDYGLLNIISMACNDIVFPAQPSSSVVAMTGRGMGMGMGMGMGALTGLFSAKAKPTAVSVSDDEVLIIREGQSIETRGCICSHSSRRAGNAHWS